MASSSLNAMRPALDSRVLTWLAVAFILLSAIALAWAFGARGSDGPRTAFAAAPEGNYLVLSTASEDPTVDIISVAPADDPASAIPIASITHLEGYAPTGAVSPDGTRLAVIIADAGSPSHPGASLLLVELLTGEVTRLAIEVDYLQTPAWAADGSGVALTRTVAGESSRSDVSVLLVPVDLAGEMIVETHPQVLGAWVVDYDPEGRRLTAVIDGSGTRIFRDGAELLSISESITRDWSLSPDGTALAFIESTATAGYLPRVVALGPGSVAAQSASSGQALGTAWAPGNTATFGIEPAGGVSAQGLTNGFDIPKGYAADGSASLVQHWSGSTFAEPGAPVLQVVTTSGRVDVPGAPEFLGWTAR